MCIISNGLLQLYYFQLNEINKATRISIKHLIAIYAEDNIYRSNMLCYCNDIAIFVPVRSKYIT